MNSFCAVGNLENVVRLYFGLDDTRAAEGDGRLTVVPTLDTFQAAIQAGAGSVMCSCEGEPS